MIIEESDMARRKGEAAYAEGGAALGKKVWRHPASEVLFRAHARGGVLLALDQA